MAKDKEIKDEEIEDEEEGGDSAVLGLFKGKNVEVRESTDGPAPLTLPATPPIILVGGPKPVEPVNTGGKQEKKSKKGKKKEPAKKAVEDDKRNPDGTYKEGVSGNPDGRPEGRKNFATLWKMFIEKVALSNNMTPEDVELHLVSVGFDKAQKGDGRFFDSLFDRVYGKAVFPISHEGEVEVKGAQALGEALQKLLESGGEEDEDEPADAGDVLQDVLSDENQQPTKGGSKKNS